MGTNEFLKKYSFFIIIALFMMLVTTPSIAQEDEYGVEAIAEEGYEYEDEAIEADGEDAYEDEAIEADGEYAYEDEAVEADGEYAYEDEAVEADGEYAYEDEAVEDGEADTEEGPKTIISVPIYQNYRIPIVVDPKNPKLPANHNFAKLRGTIWRGDEIIIRTNSRGVLGEYRPFIFFSANEDAIAYKYVPVNQQKLPDSPRTDTYITLNPLLKTNNFVPVMVAKADPLGNVALDQRIKFVINPLSLKNKDYEAALEKMRLQTEENNKSQDFTTVITNIGVIAEPVEEVAPEPVIINAPAQFYVITNRTITIITNVTQNVIQNEEVQVPTIPFVIRGGATQVQDIPSMQTMFQGVPEFPDLNTPEMQDTQEEADFFSTEQYPSYSMDPENLYDAYANDQFGLLEFLPLKMLAQDMNNTDLADDQYVINVGEQNSGIFIHKTDSVKDPYKVIFLALDKAMNLYEYNIDNTFDVRDANSDTSQKARELYLRILDEKINMKKFQKVRVKSSYLN